MLRAGLSAILTWLLSAVCGGSAVAAPRVVLVELAGGAPEVRLKVRASAEQALRELGVEVVPPGRGSPAGDGCSVPSCLAELGRQAGASHILEIQGSYMNESYNLRLDLREGATGRILGSDSKECEICSGKDFYRAIKERTVALWTRVVREQGSAAASPDASQAPAARPDSSRTGSAQSAQGARRSLWRQPLPLVGLGLALGGVVAMGFGGHYLSVNGDPDPSCAGQDDCAFTRRTAGLGWGLMAGGGAALLAGVAIVIWGRDDQAGAALSLGPGTVCLAGKF